MIKKKLESAPCRNRLEHGEEPRKITTMSTSTSIQWCHSTVNPVMGCGGCELFPSPSEILQAIDAAVSLTTGWPGGKSKSLYKVLIGRAYSSIENPLTGHSSAISTTNMWHLRKEFLQKVHDDHGKPASLAAEGAISRAMTCYAATLHLNKGRSILNPTRQMNPGYAPVFEKVTRFEGRVRAMARKKDLRGVNDPQKPWLDSLPRLVFVSDMGDAFSRDSDFDFLENEVIEPIKSPGGTRHFWLWLTKRPDRMARFGERIGGFPKNLCAMTTVTGPDYLRRIDQLRKVPSVVRGLSLEPLWERIPPKNLNLKGISWLILGGESGRREFVRPFDLSWARELRDYCRDQGVAFFLKQVGRRPIQDGRELMLRDGHGGDWSEWPDDLRIREMPEAFRAASPICN